MVRGIDLVDEEDFEYLMIIMKYVEKKQGKRPRSSPYPSPLSDVG